MRRRGEELSIMNIQCSIFKGEERGEYRMMNFEYRTGEKREANHEDTKARGIF